MSGKFDFFKTTYFKRIMVVIVVVILLYLFRDILNVLLLSLIFILLIHRFIGFIQRFIKIPSVILVIIVYAAFISLIYFVLNNFITEIMNQSEKIGAIITDFLANTDQDNTLIGSWINKLLDSIDLKSTLSNLPNLAISSAKAVGEVGFTIAIAFILSFFFMVDIKHVKEFNEKFYQSRFNWLWTELSFLAKKFIKTFGMVLETQFIISFINTILTLIGLFVLGFTHLLPLAILIFILGLIPVAGVIISFIPLAIVGYSIGGIEKVFWVIILIVFVHMFEAYFLNPKIMSSRTKLPVFVVFLILFVAEQLFGAWGLIIGIPIFVFILDLLEINIQDKHRSMPKSITFKKPKKDKSIN